MEKVDSTRSLEEQLLVERLDQLLVRWLCVADGGGGGVGLLVGWGQHDQRARWLDRGVRWGQISPPLLSGQLKVPALQETLRPPGLLHRLGHLPLPEPPGQPDQEDAADDEEPDDHDEGDGQAAEEVSSLPAFITCAHVAVCFHLKTSQQPDSHS